MTVINDHKIKTCQLQCDGCGDVSPEFDQSDFREMLSEAKRNGWWIGKVSDEWTHKCNRCGRKAVRAEDEFRRQ